MDSFLQITLSNLAVASLLAVVVFVLSRWMTKPAVLHGLWVIVLLKLVTPPVVSLPIGELGLSGDLPRTKQRPQTAEKTDPPNASVPSSQSPGIDEKPKPAKVKHFGKPSPKAAKKSAISAKPVRDQYKDLYAFEESEQIESAYRAEFDADEIAASAPFVKLERPAARETTAETNSQSASAFGSWVLGVLAVWAVGSMYVLVISLIRIVRFNRLLRHAAPAPLEMEADLKELARRLKLSRVPQLFMISAKISPVLWTTGVSTRILFPVELMKHLDAPARRTLLLHELAHYRRGDHWVRFLETFVTIVYWWNPLVRWMRRELRETEELACDAWVVATLPEARESYAYAFVKALEFLGSRGVPLPGLASGMGQFDSAKRRLCKIMTGSAPPCASFGGRLGLFAVALMLLAFWPNLGKTGEAKSQRSQRADQSKAVAEKPARRQTSAAPTVRAQAIRRLDDLVKPYSFINQEFEFQPAEDVHWCADFSPDGKLLATGSGHWTRGGLVRVWDVEKRTVVKSFREPKGTRCVDFSPDGKRLASANFSREGLVYDLETGKIALRLVGHTAMLECVDHSPDGKLIATGSNDKTVRIWNAQTGRLIRTIPAHEDRVYYVRFSKDNQTLLSGSRDDTVKHWNVQTGELIWSHTLGGDVEYAVFSPDGQTVASCSWDGTARLLDAETGNERAVFRGHRGLVLCTEFSPDGKKLATGGGDGMIRIWDVATQKTLTTLAGHTSNIYAAVFSPDGRTIASTGWDNTTRLWDSGFRQPRDARADAHRRRRPAGHARRGLFSRRKSRRLRPRGPQHPPLGSQNGQRARAVERPRRCAFVVGVFAGRQTPRQRRV